MPELREGLDVKGAVYDPFKPGQGYLPLGRGGDKQLAWGSAAHECAGHTCWNPRYPLLHQQPLQLPCRDLAHK